MWAPYSNTMESRRWSRPSCMTLNDTCWLGSILLSSPLIRFILYANLETQDASLPCPKRWCANLWIASFIEWSAAEGIFPSSCLDVKIHQEVSMVHIWRPCSNYPSLSFPLSSEIKKHNQSKINIDSTQHNGRSKDSTRRKKKKKKKKEGKEKEEKEKEKRKKGKEKEKEKEKKKKKKKKKKIDVCTLHPSLSNVAEPTLQKPA